MTARDAFGNPIVEPGEDDRVDVPPAGRRVLGRLVSLGFTALFLGVIAVPGWWAFEGLRDVAKDDSFFSSGSSATTTRSFSSTTSSTTSTSSGSGAPTSRTAPRGLAARSLLRPAALGRTLAAARRASDGRLHMLRLAPDRADLQLSGSSRGLTLLQLRWDGGRTTITTPGSVGSLKPITYASIDRHAPQRLVTAAAKRLGRSTKRIDYLLLVNILGTPTWSAYFTGGAAFQADAHGTITRRIQ